jgi:broad specificity phosphatase PhoE
MAGALCDAYEINALFASTAFRAQQTVEPLAKRLGLSVQIEPLLCEEQSSEKGTLGDRGMRALLAIRSEIGEGIAVAASHGDIIPATGDTLGASESLVRRGQWYEIVLDEEDMTVTLREAANFPL